MDHQRIFQQCVLGGKKVVIFILHVYFTLHAKNEHSYLAVLNGHELETIRYIFEFHVLKIPVVGLKTLNCQSKLNA